MRTYTEARKYSTQHPNKLVKFSDSHVDKLPIRTGAFLNGKREGIFDYYDYDNNVEQRNTYNSKASHEEHVFFCDNGVIHYQYFSYRKVIHGEYKCFNKDRTIESHYFVVNNRHIKELDYLVDEERDDAFYVTLALYGIEKEYTIGG